MFFFVTCVCTHISLKNNLHDNDDYYDDDDNYNYDDDDHVFKKNMFF